MLKSSSTLLMLACLASLHISSANAHSGAVSLHTYTWSKPDADVSLEIPSSTNSQLEKAIYAALTQIAHASFGNKFYIPKSLSDPKFSKKLAKLYKAQEEESAKIPTDAPVFSYKMTTVTLTNSTDLVSLQLNTFANQKGAAHPTSSGGFINLVPKTKTFISDLSFLNPEAQERIFNQVQAELESKLKRSLLVKGEALKKLIPHHFGFKNKKLLFTFWSGEVAPYFNGPQTLEIPFSDSDRLQELP